MRTEEEFMALVEAKMASQPAKRPLGKRVVLLAATLALLAAAAFGTAVLLDRDEPPAHEAVTENDGTTTDAAVGSGEIPPYVYVAQETGIAPGKYDVDLSSVTASPEIGFDAPEVVYPVPGEITYSGRTYVRWGMGEPLDPTVSIRGEFLGDGLYALAGVSTEYYILKEKEGLWGYMNYDYRPATLGQLITDLNLTENLQMGTLYYNTLNGGRYSAWQIDGLDGAKLWSMLFADPDAVPQRLTVQIDPNAAVEEAAAQGVVVSPPYDPSGEYIYERTLASDVSIAISLPALGIENLSIGISREGWLWTNLLSSGNYFAVSPTLVDEILAYAKAEGSVQDITPAEPVSIPTVAEPSVPEAEGAVSTARAEETVVYSVTQGP